MNESQLSLSRLQQFGVSQEQQNQLAEHLESANHYVVETDPGLERRV